MAGKCIYFVLFAIMEHRFLYTYCFPEGNGPSFPASLRFLQRIMHGLALLFSKCCSTKSLRFPLSALTYLYKATSHLQEMYVSAELVSKDLVKEFTSNKTGQISKYNFSREMILSYQYY